jgi:hypothetical protein
MGETKHRTGDETMDSDQPITADTAYKFADNFSIWSEDGLMFYGCEHNQQEAEAVAKWIYNNRGRKTIVRKNRPDQVEKARAIRGGDVPRYQLREEALVAMGVWTSGPKRRRRTAR